MELSIKPFKPRRSSSNTLFARAEEFIYWKAITSAPSTVLCYSKCLKRFQKWVNAEKVRDINPLAIYKYFIFRSRSNKGKVAVGQDRNLLSAFFAWCVQRGYMATNPVSIPQSAFQKPKINHKTLSDEEYEKLKVCASNSEWRYAIVCSRRTALRMSDVCLLKWEHIDFDKNVISILPKKTNKTGKMAVVPIHPELEDILRLRSISRMENEQFVSEELAILYQRDRSVTLAKQFRKILDRAGIVGRTFHSLRHSALEVWMNHPNSDVITVMDMSGHSSASTLAKYCQPSIEKKKLIMGLDKPTETKQISHSQ